MGDGDLGNVGMGKKGGQKEGGIGKGLLFYGATGVCSYLYTIFLLFSLAVGV